MAKRPSGRVPERSGLMAPRSFRQLDLNLLVALEALLMEKSVTLAGERVGVTQSAMSGSLARLRSFFGDQLLVRTGRTNVLTAKGEELLQPVHEILTRIDDTLSSRTAFDPYTSDREFSIAASDYVVYSPLDVVSLQPTWHRGRVIVMGDAAHATAPHLTQGAGMALEDGVVLAETLRGFDGTVPEAFQAVEDRRRNRVTLVQQASEAIMRREMSVTQDTFAEALEFTRSSAPSSMSAVTAELDRPA